MMRKRDKNNRRNPNVNSYNVRQTQPSPPSHKRNFIDFDTSRICPACGRLIKIAHNFCKH